MSTFSPFFQETCRLEPRVFKPAYEVIPRVTPLLFYYLCNFSPQPLIQSCTTERFNPRLVLSPVSLFLFAPIIGSASSSVTCSVSGSPSDSLTCFPRFLCGFLICCHWYLLKNKNIIPVYQYQHTLSQHSSKIPQCPVRENLLVISCAVI